ncbi:MAG TPA: hypothetical protein PK473_03065 [Nitrosomonas sp.]|nr:hypothetical protein [Nitrosomonas sp.]
MQNFFLVSILIIFLCFICDSLIKIIKLLKSCTKSLNSIEAFLKSIGKASRIEFYKIVDGQKIRIHNMQIMKVNQNLPVTIAITDALGNAALVDGLPVWTATNPELVDIEVAEGAMSALVKAKGIVGQTTIQVKADAKIGEGETLIVGELMIDLVALEAQFITLTAGTPVDQE